MESRLRSPVLAGVRSPPGSRGLGAALPFKRAVALRESPANTCQSLWPLATIRPWPVGAGVLGVASVVRRAAPEAATTQSLGTPLLGGCRQAAADNLPNTATPWGVPPRFPFGVVSFPADADVLWPCRLKLSVFTPRTGTDSPSTTLKLPGRNHSDWGSVKRWCSVSTDGFVGGLACDRKGGGKLRSVILLPSCQGVGREKWFIPAENLFS